jgi:hypothetical protein
MEKEIREKIATGEIKYNYNPFTVFDKNTIYHGGTIEDSNYNNIGHYESTIYFVNYNNKWYRVTIGGEIIDFPEDEQPTYSDEFEIEEYSLDELEAWFYLTIIN